MLYFFTVVTGQRQINDPEGSEFANLEAAKVEAQQIAREVAGEELRGGLAVYGNWHIDVADKFGNALATVFFDRAILVPKTVEANLQSADQTFSERRKRTEAVVKEMRRIAAELRTTYWELRARIEKI